MHVCWSIAAVLAFIYVEGSSSPFLRYSFGVFAGFHRGTEESRKGFWFENCLVFHSADFRFTLSRVCFGDSHSIILGLDLICQEPWLITEIVGNGITQSPLDVKTGFMGTCEEVFRVEKPLLNQVKSLILPVNPSVFEHPECLDSKEAILAFAFDRILMVPTEPHFETSITRSDQLGRVLLTSGPDSLEVGLSELMERRVRLACDSMLSRKMRLFLNRNIRGTVEDLAKLIDLKALCDAADHVAVARLESSNETGERAVLVNFGSRFELVRSGPGRAHSFRSLWCFGGQHVTPKNLRRDSELGQLVDAAVSRFNERSLASEIADFPTEYVQNLRPDRGSGISLNRLCKLAEDPSNLRVHPFSCLLGYVWS